MQVSGVGGQTQAAQTAALMQVLKTAQEMPAEMIQKLLAVNVENMVDAQSMELAGQIIDVYA